jgi:hypothetical protein
MHAAGRRDHSLSMRLQEADIALIDRAADLRGRSRTDFVREAALGANSLSREGLCATGLSPRSVHRRSAVAIQRSSRNGDPQFYDDP